MVECGSRPKMSSRQKEALGWLGVAEASRYTLGVKDFSEEAFDS